MKFVPVMLATLMLFAACKKKDNPQPAQPPTNTGQAPTGQFTRVNKTYTEDLTDISFADDLNGVVVGTYGFLSKTNDGGKTWQPLARPTGQSLVQVHYLRKGHIFAARLQLHYSNNDGNSFTEISNGLSKDFSIKGIHFFDDHTGIILKGDGAYKTKDKGATWQPTYFQPGYLNILQFASAKVGYIFGGRSYDGATEGEMYKTTDAGEHWQPMGNIALPQVTAAFFVNENTGYITTFNRQVMKTTDGGKTWKTMMTGFADYITDMAFADEHMGYVTTTSGKIYKTENDGAKWDVAYTVADTSLNSITITPNKKIWVTGNSGVMLTR